MNNTRTEQDFWASIYGTTTIISAIQKKRHSRIPVSSSASKSLIFDVCNTKNKNIENFTNLISNKKLKVIAKQLISDTYKFNFESSKSVDSNITGMELNYNLESLQNINLLEHSFGVLNVMIDILDQKYGIYSDFFFIAALVHDFGKSVSLKKHYEIDLSIPHHEASSEYLKKIYKRDKSITDYYCKLLQAICDVFDAHHNSSLENQFHALKKEEENKEFHILIIKFLKMADTKQRNIEMEKLR